MEKQKIKKWDNPTFRKVRDIILFISLGFNLLIAILFSVVGCSVQEYDNNSNDHTNQPLIHTKYNAVNNALIDNSIYRIIMPAVIPNNLSGGTVYYPTHDYGVYQYDDYQVSDKVVKSYKGDTIRRTVWFNEQERTDSLTFTFYNYEGTSQYELHYVRSSDNNFRPSDSFDLARFYLAYNRDNKLFFDYITNCGGTFEYINSTDFTFNNNWNVYDYVNSVNGLMQTPTSDDSGRFLINNSNFYINNERYNFMYFDFALPSSYQMLNTTYVAYINSSGSLVDAQIDNYLDWDSYGPYRYIFKGLYVGRNGDSSSLTRIATPTYSSVNVNTNANPLFMKVENAGSFEFTNDSYRSLTLTGSSYVDYLESYLFPYNYNEETQNITLKGQPNENVQSYLSYSYTLHSEDDIFIGGETNYNPIDLIGLAFGGLVGIFSVNILPGIALGTLFFLPLVISLIVLIFKAVKK